MDCALFPKMDKSFQLKKHLKNTGKWGKILENQGKVRNFVSAEKWEPWACVIYSK